MAVDFPPEFPFHRKSSDAPSPASASPAVAPSAGSPVSGASTAGPRLVTDDGPATPPPVQFVSPTPGQPPAQERRRSPRMTLVAKATIRPDTPVQMPNLVSIGFVSNVSMNGVGFHTRKPLEVGSTYRLTVEAGPLKWCNRMRIVTCRHHAETDTFHCGGEFIGNELNRLSAAA